MAHLFRHSWLLKLLAACIVTAAALWMVIVARRDEHTLHRSTTTSYDPVKRGLDILVSLLALTIAGPILLVLAVLVRLKIGTPVLFRQQRRFAW